MFLSILREQGQWVEQDSFIVIALGVIRLLFPIRMFP